MKKNRFVQLVCGWICFIIAVPCAILFFDALRNTVGLDGMFHTVADFRAHGLYRDLAALFIILGGPTSLIMFCIWFGVLVGGTPDEKKESNRIGTTTQTTTNRNNVGNNTMTSREQKIFMEEFDRYQQSATHKYYENMKK